MPVLLFLVLLVVTFAVVWVITTPSRKENELGKRLAGLDRSSVSADQEVGPDILKREVYSDLPVVNAILGRLKLAADIDALIKQANSSWTVGRVVFGALAILFVVGVLSATWFHSVPIGIVLGLVAANIPYISLRIQRSARLTKFATVLPDAIDLMGRALRAGHAVTAAIEMVAREIPDPVGMEFRRVFEEQNFGIPLREALLHLAQRVPVPDLHFLVTAMLVQKETGGNLAEVLDKAGAVIRERSRLLGQLRIYTAQGRMTGWILGLLPFIVFGLMNFLNPGYARIMIEDPMGRKAIWLGLGLMAIGVWMIRKIVDIKV
ncbi:MAG TPA: type II secretion system F family protein [Candidatus Saccharimonadales bacterium]|nr:type II secretion system F family protein [Candidatus Saccharimonadales bacterium]